MLPILNIGPLAIQTPGLILLLGVWIGLNAAERQAIRLKIDPNLIYNLSMLMIGAGILGARLGYAALHPQAFASDWISLVSLNPGLLDAWSGLAVGLISGLIFIYRKGLGGLSILDVYTPALAVMAVAAACANLASGNGFGAPTELPWALELWGARRHPTQIYEMVAGLIILWLCRPGSRFSHSAIPEAYFLTFMAFSAGARVFLEAFHGDSALLPGGFRQVQVAAWFILAGCLWGLAHLRRKTPVLPTTPVQ